MEEKKSHFFGALIVTYNPIVNQLKQSLSQLIGKFDTIVVVDNGSDNVSDINELADIHLISLNSNVGIATALNIGFEYFDSQKFDWVLTLDQDSRFPKDGLAGLIATQLTEKNDTAIIATQFADPSWSVNRRNESIVDESSEPIQINFAITSGNLVRIAAWKKVGGFDDWLFIDKVDFDFDARLLRCGFKIWQANGVVLDHKIGDRVKFGLRARLLGYKQNDYLMQHAPIREYYWHRNAIVFDKRYPEYSKFRRPTWLFSFLQLRSTLIADRPVRGFLMALKGLIDGYRSKDKW